MILHFLLGRWGIALGGAIYEIAGKETLTLVPKRPQRQGLFGISCRQVEEGFEIEINLNHLA